MVRSPVRGVLVGAVLVGCVLRVDAQDPVKAFPKNYSMALENSAVAVVRVHYGPHERVGVHDHSRYPTVYVYLSDSPPVRFAHEETPPFVLVRPPVSEGAFRVSPGRVERHSVENLGDGSSDFLRVELKQVPLGGVQAFRGAAPRSLSRDVDEVAYKEPGLEIDRVICTRDAGACVVKKTGGAALLVAFTPVIFSEGGPGNSRISLKAGEVRWIRPMEDARIAPAGIGPAHVLRIVSGR